MSALPVSPAPLTLYSGLGTCALAVHLGLEEAGADYSIVPVDFANNQQRSPEYLQRNPLGRVPVLETARGVLTEVPAILAYLAQTYPASPVGAGDDAFMFAQAQSFNCFLSSSAHVAHAHGRRAYRWSDDAAAQLTMVAKVPGNLLDLFQIVEAKLSPGPWVLGERFSISDPYLYVVGGWLEKDGVDVTLLPRLLQHRQAMEARPAIRRVLDALLGLYGKR